MSIRSSGLLVLSILLFTHSSHAQVVGKLGEMDRLEEQADDLAAQADSEGAALAIGKAAMMAKVLSQQHGQGPKHSLFGSVEKFFRGQEYVYRALAIFQQTGGQPPAPDGVCSFLEQAEESMTQSNAALTELKNREEPVESRKRRYISQISDWQVSFYEIKTDLAC